MYTIDTLGLLKELHRDVPTLQARVEILDGFVVISYLSDGDVCTDPVEHHNRTGDYGHGLVNQAIAEAIGDHNWEYNRWFASGQ